MADAKVVITAEDRTKAALRSAKKNLDDFAGALTGLKGQLSLIAGAVGIGALIKSQLELGDQLSKTSQKIGVSVENLSAYQYAAKLSGVSNDELRTSLSRLAKAMQEATQDQGGETAQFFRSLGVAISDTNGRLRDTGAVFEDLSRVFANAPDGPQKTAAAMKLLGRSGSEMIPLMNSLRELKAEAQATGNVVSTDFAKKAEEFNDSMERLQGAAQRMARAITTAVLPVLANMAEHLSVITGAQVDYSLSRLTKERDTWLRVLKESNDEFARTNDTEALRTIEKAEATLADLEKRITAATARKKALSAPDGKTPLNLPSQGDKDQKALLAEAQAISAQLLSEEEKQRASYAIRLGTLTAAREQELISQATFNEDRERLELEHQARMGDIFAQNELARRNFQAMTFQQQLATVQGGMQMLSQLMQSKSKSLFEIGKKSAAAEAAIATHAGAIKAYQALAGIPIVGPALGIAAAAALTAFGVERVRGILSTNFGGGVSATGSVGVSASTGFPTGSIGGGDFQTPPDVVPSAARAASPGRDFNITLQGRSFDAETVRELITAINEQVGDGVNLNVTVAA